MDLGPHAHFIIASYTLEVIVLSALVAWLLFDGARQKKLLADLDARGITRRPASRKDNGNQNS